jgi:hypothetical protein
MGLLRYKGTEYGILEYMSIPGKKIAFFETTLLNFFQKVGREHLPWRRKRITAYEVWVSEIMLQQTQVSRVIEYYPYLICGYQLSAPRQMLPPDFLEKVKERRFKKCYFLPWY